MKAETYVEPIQTSNIKQFMEIVNGWNLEILRRKLKN